MKWQAAHLLTNLLISGDANKQGIILSYRIIFPITLITPIAITASSYNGYFGLRVTSKQKRLVMIKVEYKIHRFISSNEVQSLCPEFEAPFGTFFDAETLASPMEGKSFVGPVIVLTIGCRNDLMACIISLPTFNLSPMLDFDWMKPKASEDTYNGASAVWLLRGIP